MYKATFACLQYQQKMQIKGNHDAYKNRLEPQTKKQQHIHTSNNQSVFVEVSKYLGGEALFLVFAFPVRDLTFARAIARPAALTALHEER